jgi:hypothetical protein
MVRQVAVPPAARALSTLSHIDYEDAFLVDRAQNRTAEQWARAILEDAPIAMRSALWWGWSALGLKLGSPWSDRSVLGWELRKSTPEHVLLGARSRLGMPAELLVKRGRHKFLFATFVQKETQIARAVWAGIDPVHRPILRYALEQAGRRERG